MKVMFDRPVMIFKSEYNDKPIYKIGLSRKDQNGNYEKGYMLVKFRKGVEVDNMTKIKVIDNWLDFYKQDVKTIPYIFVNEFDVADKNEIPVEKLNTKSEFDFGQQIEITDDDLPF